jgi:uncharacterized protein
MTKNLLEAPERDVIEAFLSRLDTEDGPSPCYERLLGFLSGVAITPGQLMPSDWMQPLLDLNGIIFSDFKDANGFMGALMPLYNRVNEVASRGESLYPFDLNAAADLDGAQQLVREWGIGLHGALTLRPEIWAPEDDEVRHVPKDLLAEEKATIPFIWALAEPEAIPEIAPDPVPFQRAFLATVPGWQEDMFRETWDEELTEMFTIFCIGRLKSTIDILQRYGKAYGKGGRAGFASRPVPMSTPIKSAKVGRNDPCPCGSGAKYKKCCGG